MTGFDDVTLEWGGEKYTVSADRQMGLIMRIEDALSGDSGQQAISVLLAPEGPSYGRLSSAFGAALRYAGADVSDLAIYNSIMEDMAVQRGDVVVKVQRAVLALLAIIAAPIAEKMASVITDDDEKK